VNSLSRWLKKAPQPRTLRYTTADDEERSLSIGSSPRRWKEAEAALLDVNAVRVEALDEQGNVLRVEVLRPDLAGEDGDKPAAVEVARAKETAALALVLDAQGKRITDAFREGADAASRGQDNLVQVVNILTGQWSATMNAVHTLSMQLAKALRANGGDEDDDGMSTQMQQLIGIAAMKMMGGNGAPETKKDK